MKDRRLAALLRQGHAAREQGRAEEALRHYRAAIDFDPDSAEAQTVLGLLLLLLDRAVEAEAPLRRAMELEPSRAACRLNFTRWLLHQGRLDEAAELAATVTQEQPDLWWAWDRRADVDVRRGRFGEAASHYAEAARLHPEDPALLFRWARASFDAGQHMEALAILETAGRLAPGKETVLRLRTEIFQAMTEWVALGQAAKEWIDAHPESWEAWRCLAQAQIETGYLRQARQTWRRSLELGGRDADALASYGRLCLKAMEYEAAARAFEQAEALDPRNGHLLSGKGMLQMVTGDHEGARRSFRRAIEANVHDADAWTSLVQLTGGRVEAGEFEALRALAADPGVREEERIAATFALADCLDARDEREQAFEAWQRANELTRERAGAEGAYDPTVRAAQTDELITLFDRLPDAEDDETSPRPVFIVGMPRSGTALIESVLGAHPQVFACGERMEMRWILQEYLDERRRAPESAIPQDSWRRWREFYRRELPDLGGPTVITDRNPWNFDSIGLILRLFPRARIVHVRRSPVESGFSIFRHPFSRLSAFAHRLEDIAHFHGEYARLMAHWERVAAGRFWTVQYEALLGQFDAAAPELVAACGLPWEPACAEYGPTRRPIATTSTAQARRPPGPPPARAADYAAPLAPLRDALAAAGVDPVTGDFLTSGEGPRSNTQPRARPGSSVGRAAD